MVKRTYDKRIFPHVFGVNNILAESRLFDLEVYFLD